MNSFEAFSDEGLLTLSRLWPIEGAEGLQKNKHGS
jgi:hypothetical protein